MDPDSVWITMARRAAKGTKREGRKGHEDTKAQRVGTEAHPYFRERIQVGWSGLGESGQGFQVVVGEADVVAAAVHDQAHEAILAAQAIQG